MNNGTQIAMFDIADQLNSKWDGRSGVRIQDGYLFQVEEERRQNSLMWSIENRVNTKTLEQGFTLEVLKAGGLRSKIVDPNDSPYLAHLWHNALQQVNNYRLRVGYCVVQKRTIRDPNTIPDEEAELAGEAAEIAQRRSRLPQQTVVSDATDNPEITADEEISQFLERERERLSKRKPRAAPSLKRQEVLGYEVPYVMDLLSECYVKFYIGKDKKRIYKAFQRTAETQNNQPLADTIVIVFHEPDAYGVPQSAFLSCLEDLQAARGMLQRWDQRDYWNTHVPYIYKSVPRGAGEAIVPADAHINYSVTDTELPGEHTAPVWTAPVRMEDHTLDKRIAQLEASNRYMADALDDSVSKAAPPNTQLTRPKYNKQLERLTHIGPIDQFSPYHIIPDQMELASNAPKPIHSGDWLAIYNLLMNRIANACGVMADTLTGERVNVASDADNRRAEGDSAVRVAQTHIERTIAQIYVAIFMPIHREEIRSELRQRRFEKRMAALEQSDEQHRQRVLLRQEIEELERALQSSPEDGEVRIKLHDHKQDKIRKLGEIPPLDIDADDMPWDDRREYTGDTGQQRVQDDMMFGDSDEFMQIRMEMQLQIKVHVRENPSLTYADARTLYTDKVITRERFGQIALRTLGLPDDYLASEQELDKESQLLAKREKRYNDASGANDTVAVGNEPKRMKPTSTNPDQDKKASE